MEEPADTPSLRGVLPRLRLLTTESAESAESVRTAVGRGGAYGCYRVLTECSFGAGGCWLFVGSKTWAATPLVTAANNQA